MKKYLYTILLFILSNSLFSQGNVTNRGMLITLRKGVEVSIMGDYENQSDPAKPQNLANAEIVSEGNIRIAGNLRNKGTNNVFGTDSGTVTFIGGRNQEITSRVNLDSTNWWFHNIKMEKTGGVVQVLDSIRVRNELKFGMGNIVLEGANLNLGTSGYFTNESENSRVLGIHGVVKATSQSSLSRNYYVDISGIGIEVKGSFGQSKVERGHRSLDAGNGSITRYYNFSPNVYADTSTFRFSYFDGELASATEAELEVYHSPTGLVWRKQSASLYTTNTLEQTFINTRIEDAVFTLAEEECDVKPVFSIGDTIYLCTDDSILLDVGIEGLEYTWSTKENTKSIFVDSSGWYSVASTNIHGCTGVDSVLLIDQPKPIASFTHDLFNCLSDTTSFINNSTIVGGSIAKYEWDFNIDTLAGDTSNLHSPTFRYPTYGNYTVALKVTSDFGCTAVDTSTQVKIMPLPEPNFFFDTVCDGHIVSFTDTSSIADTTVIPSTGLVRTYNFGDFSSSSNTIHPTHLYSSAGSYYTTLTVEALNTGCKDSITKEVIVHPNPVASFTSMAECAYDTVDFINTSTDNQVNTWYFGDGDSSKTENTEHIYPQEGNYHAVLAIENQFGCKDTVTQQIQVDTVPVANFNMNNGCQLTEISFTNTTTQATNVHYLWQFGDGTSSTDINPVHTYAQSGTFNITLTATKANGCSHSVSKEITIYPKPIAHFSVNDVCDKDTITGYNTSSILSGSFTSFWKLGYNTTSHQTDVQHTYATNGIYPIQLTITSDLGCKDSIADTIQIYALPSINFASNIVTCGSTYTLDAGNIGSTYLWSDNSTNQTLSTTVDGMYNVTITSTEGCVNTAETILTLNSNPITNLGNDTTVCDAMQLVVPYQNGSSYQWSTADTSHTINVTSTGQYTVQVLDQNACTSVDTINVVVHQSPVFTLGNDTTICNQQTLHLDPAIIAPSYTWSTTEVTPTINVTTADTYWIAITNSDNCTTRDSIVVNINPLPAIGLADTIQACDSILLDVGTVVAKYLWSTTDTTQTLLVNTGGTYTVRVEDTNQCVQRDTTVVNLFSSPLFSLGNDTTLCSNQALTLDFDTIGVSYLWSDGSTSSLNTFSIAGNYGVEITDSNQCTSRDSIEISTDFSLTLNLGEDKVLCNFNTVQLDAGIADNYTWYNNGNILSNQQKLTIIAPGIYSVVVANNTGCTLTDSIELIQSTETITANFLEPSIINVGDTVQFVQVSYPFSGLSQTWFLGDGTTSSEVHPQHTYYLPNDYLVTLVAYNEDCADTVSKTIKVLPLQEQQEQQEQIVQKGNIILEANLYPNPNDGSFSVEASFAEEGTVYLTIYNMMGQQYSKKEHKTTKIDQTYHMGEVPKGLYFVQIKTEHDLKTIRFVKQ